MSAVGHKTIQVLKIHPDGGIERVKIEQSKLYDLTTQLVGGYIELIPCPIINGVGLYVNDEGALRNMPVNPTASLLALRTIVGEALLYGGVDGEGFEEGLTEDQLGALFALMGRPIPPLQEA